MDQKLLQDLQTILHSRLELRLFDSLIEHLEHSASVYPDSIRLKTRNDRDQLLSYQGITYFSVVYTLREKPVISAGAVVKNSNGDFVPVMRFRDQNSALSDVPPGYRFPYTKPNWTNVEIRMETIELFPRLLDNEIRSYFAKYASTSRKPTTNGPPKGPTEGYGPMLSFIFGIVGFVAGLYSDSDFLVIGGLLTAIAGLVVLMVGMSTGKYTEPPPSVTYHSASTETEWGSSIGCPRCGSNQITAQKRGFKVGRAVGVGLATGAVGGLLAGAAGKDKITITCLKCGKQWSP